MLIVFARFLVDGEDIGYNVVKGAQEKWKIQVCSWQIFVIWKNYIR